MPWNSPSLTELAEGVRADIRGRVSSARPELRRSLLRVIADVDAGVAHGLYGYLAWLAKQLMIDTADAEYLERWAGIWRIEREEAVSATGPVLLTGTSGAQVLQDTELEHDSGAVYTVDDTVTLDAQGNAVAQLTAVEPGASGNLDAGATLRFVEPVSGVNAEATVDTEGLTGGADQEDIERLRERLLERIRRQPHGGSEADYIGWALEAHPDVTRAWVYPHQPDEGEVSLRLVCDELANIIPTDAVIQAVETYIDGERPVAARGFYAVKPVAKPLDPSIRLTPDTQQARDRVSAALKDFLTDVAKPGGTLYREQLSGVIYVAAGDSRHELVMPDTDVVHAINEIAVLGTPTWL
ncbi:baseplate J/gp47 family protein [Marinobacter subterrani]|uniref:Putative phage protein gp47/JayE n=1 Tax=Marinobacter subterrani TaxID=1658765 RepID=A0A0J7LY78_9GAMM|nr:baseplate J/gp47 family protein [Marinobacter subterrani]KMQ72831.1 putative phage protein gp47/JayE [Marinobacter subterrani]KMQ73855.1 putative phage protein gp47/JayE [Marinobacter subterrani]KMQ75318.1 putative phage protein gp47/JayE [Marinobacter subterrani]